MKKIFSKVLGCALALTVAAGTLAGCGGGESNNWTKPTMVSGGNVIAASNGGLVAETEKYVYYVNGAPTEGDVNTFGAPIKGTLMVLDKANPSGKSEIVVPKLFAASDANAGVFIWNGYAYYGTSNTDKDSSGNVASGELVFERTKLDGTANERLFVAGSDLAAEYRIVKNGNKVYIVYYDAEETALKVFDVDEKKEKVIAKTDEKSSGNYSLGEYKFVKDANGEIAVVYTVTVYSEKYFASRAEEQGYSRALDSYNLVMAYKAGDAADQETGMLGKIVCDGKSGEKTYAFTYNVNDKVFFTETPLSGTVKNYGASVASLYGEGAKVQLETTEYAAKEVLIKDFDEAYKISGNKIIKGTMVGNDYAQREVVAIVTDATLLIDIFGEDLYYLSGSGKIMRIKLGDELANEIVVSDSTALTGWFAPEFVTVGEKSYLFYATDSEADFGYVKFVDVNSEVKEEDNVCSLGDSTLIGIKTESDKASGVAALIVEASEAVDEDQALKLKKDDSNGTLYSEKLNEAIAAYNDLKEETKALVDQEKMAILNKLKKAVEMANVYNKLEGMYGYDNKNSTEQAAVRAVYDEVKGQLQAFVDSSEYSDVQVLIPNNIKSYYTDALRKFK